MRKVKAVHDDIPPETDKSFDDFFTTSYPRLLAYLIKVSGHPELARDICQDIYLQLWGKRGNLPAGAEEKLHYLFTVARNAFYQHTRKSLREQQELKEYVQQDPLNAAQEPENKLELADQQSIIHEILGSAREDRKKYFLLNREEGLTYKQIAEQEGVSEKTVERYIGSIVKSLRTRLSSFFLW